MLPSFEGVKKSERFDSPASASVLRRAARRGKRAPRHGAPLGSTFDPILRYLRDEGVGAYSWGFVIGKSQTIYPWDSWEKKYTGAPKVWFHDIFDKDGKPYDPKEVAFLREMTGKK
jgi:hypothetical protein